MPIEAGYPNKIVNFLNTLLIVLEKKYILEK